MESSGIFIRLLGPQYSSFATKTSSKSEGEVPLRLTIFKIYPTSISRDVSPIAQVFFCLDQTFQLKHSSDEGTQEYISKNVIKGFRLVVNAATEHHLTTNTPLYAQTGEQNSEDEPIRRKPFDLQLSVRSTWTPTFTSQRNTFWNPIIRKCEPKLLTQFYTKS
ncbi:hypothetical protein CDAR_574931 [Caerostris darwini]|uniref:Uncharacterized protein n=1 Tax=Caerostris darwini TaxID=1538125 RepID=A0AAV4SZA0_9ARAC|nr:hypothetical protein CDAR_574931 [Caerostris darwini]